jgi:hypothetical protein
MTNILNPDFVAQEIAGAGQLTVKQLMELSGKAETTVRTVLKTMVEESRIIKVDDVKPATYRMATEAEVAEMDDEDPEYGVSYKIELDEEAEAKLNEIMGAITAPQPEAAPVKVKKSKKVGRTDVPSEHNVTVRVDGELMWVTDAYALLEEPPQFIDIAEVQGIALGGEETAGADHTAEQIAALYYHTVASYLELLLDEEAITRPVWYGRTCRLRHLVVGHGRGTASAKPVGTTSDK